MSTGRVLEVIATSVGDAVEAANGGADRLEIVRDFERDGLTPAVSLIREIRREVPTPFRVMLREKETNELADGRELQEYVRLAREFMDAGADGVVFGFLRDGQIDVEPTRALLAQLNACKRNATFHRAFDAAEDPVAAITMLKKCAGIDRILTSGGTGTWEVKARRLSQLYELGAPEITILAGGGLDAQAIRVLLERTLIREFHTGRAVREAGEANGKVQAKLVSELAHIVHSGKQPLLLSDPVQP